MNFFKQAKVTQLFGSVLAALISAVIFSTSFGERVEIYFNDMWYAVRGTRTVPSEVVVVAMDELSYKNLNVPLSQGWPRALHAKALEKLAEYGARKVIFDILFLDAGADPKADEALAKAIAKLPVVLGVESAVQQVGAAGGSFSLEELLEPYLPFKKAANDLAIVALPESNAHIRRFMIQRTERTLGIPSLAEAGANVSFNSSQGSDSKVPDVNDHINYYGKARTIPTYSFYQLLEEERPLDKKIFEDKIVYIGLSLRTDIGPAQKDVFINPVNSLPIFGVEVHAAACANLLEKSWIRRASPLVEGALVTFVILILSFLILSVSPVTGAIITALFALLWSVCAYVGFVNFYFIPGAFISFIALPLVFVIATFRSFVVTRRSELKLKSAFELYVSPEMVSKLQKDQMAIKLGGQKVWATAMFTDIAGFTDITETLPPEKVVEMLNEYFSEVMDVVFRNKGTLIKFIGDAVFVIWGAPVPMDNHAILAVQTARELIDAVNRFNSTKKYPELKTRIGVNTGPMVVGNLGSNKRFDYTAIGDSVNLAARVEGLNKKFGTDVIVTESVRKDAGLSKDVLPLGDVRVKGKEEAVSLFTFFSPPVVDEAKENITQALKAFQRGNWEQAIHGFDNAVKEDKRLSVIAGFYKRYINEKAKNIDIKEWSGDVVLEDK